MINEMTTLASIGEMPALPMGLRYPRGLFGKARRSKRLHFRKLSKLRETTMRYIVIPDFLARLEETGSIKRRNKNRKREIEARQGEKEHPETITKYKATTANQIKHAMVARGLHRTGDPSVWGAMQRKAKHKAARNVKKIKGESINEADFLTRLEEAVDPEERKLRLKKIIAGSIKARHGAKMAHDVLRGLQDRGPEFSAARKAKNQLLDKSYRSRLIMQKFTGKDYRINELTPTTKLGTGKDSFRNRARAHAILRFDRGMSGKGEGPFGKDLGDFRRDWVARKRLAKMRAKKLSSK